MSAAATLCRAPLAAAALLLSTTLLTACASAPPRSPGSQLLEQRRWAEAATAWRARLAVKPDDAEARRGYDAARRAAAAEHQLAAQQLEQKYDLPGALAALDQALAYDPQLEAARTDQSRLRRQLRLLTRQLAAAESTLGRGDCLAAREQLDGLAAYSPSLPRVPEVREQAMRRCFERELTLARLQLELRNYSQALLFLDQAAPYFPGHAEVAALRRQAEDGLACRTGLRQGADLLARSEEAAAAQSLRVVLERCPGDPEVRQAWEGARRRGLGSVLDEGAKAVRANDPLAALIAYETALELGIEDAPLQARVQQLAAAYRVPVAAALYAAGERDAVEALPGAAMIRFRLAEALAPGQTDAATRAGQAEQQATAAARLQLAVLPPENPTAHPWLGKELGAEVAQALRAELAASPDLEVIDGWGRGLPALVVSGKIAEFAIESPEPTDGSRPLDALVGERRSTNPALLEALTRSLQARRLRRDHPGDAAAAQAGAEAQAALAATPAVRQEPVRVAVAQPLAQLTLSGRARLALTVRDRQSGGLVAEPLVAADYRSEDSLWSAFPPAGVEAQLPTLPTFEAVRRRLVLDLVEKVKPQLGQALRSLAGQRLVALAREGRGDEAVDLWAMAMLAGGEQAGEARERLVELTGYRAPGGARAYEVRRLSY